MDQETGNLQMPIQNRSTLSIVAVLALGLAAVYCLPYYVPEHDGISYSYMFGFNNRAAALLLVAFVTGFALWTRGLGLTLPDLAGAPPQPFRASAYTAIAISTCTALVLWIATMAAAPYAEAQYFLDRYEMYRIFGHPYHAFTFLYGPILFYLPIWIANLTHLSVPNSYYASLVIEWFLGTWVLWKLVRLASQGTAGGREIFLICWLLIFPSIVQSGAQYTPLRYAPALLFAVVVDRLYRSGASIGATFGVASIGVVATLFYSPEQGISFFLGTLLFFLFCVRARRTGTMAGLAGLALCFAIAAGLALRMGVFNSVVAISGGALNLPLVASSMSVVPLLLLIIAGCVVVAGFRSSSSDHPLVYLVCISLVNLPAGFSRADPGHVTINALGAIIAALVVLSQYPAAWRWARIAMAVVIMHYLAGMNGYRAHLRNQVLSEAFAVQDHSPALERLVVRFVTLWKGPRAEARLDELRKSYARPIDPTKPILPPHSEFMAPMGLDRRMVPFSGDPQIISGRSVIPLTSISDVQEKIDELEAHRDRPLLLFTADPIKCESDPYSTREGLKNILGAYYMPAPKRRILVVVPLCDYINANYVLSNYLSPVPGYYVWVPKGNGNAAN